MKTYVTRRPNGLYMLTRNLATRCKVCGLGHDDIYITPGDMIGLNNLCQPIVHSLCGELEPFWYVQGSLSFEPTSEPQELKSPVCGPSACCGRVSDRGK